MNNTLRGLITAFVTALVALLGYFGWQGTVDPPDVEPPDTIIEPPDTIPPDTFAISAALEEGAVRVTWNDQVPEDIIGLAPVRSLTGEDGSFSNLIAGDLAASTREYVDESVISDVTYYYRLRWHHSGDTYSASAIASVTVPPDSTEPPDTVLAATVALSGLPDSMAVGDTVAVTGALLDSAGAEMSTLPSEWDVQITGGLSFAGYSGLTNFVRADVPGPGAVRYEHLPSGLEAVATTQIGAPPDTTEPPDTVIEPPDTTGQAGGPGETHEPPGMTPVGHFDGSVKEENGHAFGIAGFNSWTIGNTIEVVDDISNPVGSGKSLRFRWRPNVHPSVGITRMRGIPGGPYQEIYVRWRIILEPGEGAWEFGHKFFYLAQNASLANGNSTTDRPSGGTPRPIRYTGGGPTAYSNNPSRGSTGANLYPLRIGHWFTAELHVRMQTPGTTDGFAYLWVDGVLVAKDEGASAAFVWEPHAFFDYIEWYGNANNVTKESFYRIGELHISGKN